MKLYTPFYKKHVEYGCQMVDYLSWQVPRVYTSFEEEYRMVRERAGFTDYSPMPRYVIAGKDALKFVQKVLANDANKISPGRVIYSSLLDETGKVFTDGTLFWIEDNYFYLVVEVDRTGWLEQHTEALDVYITQVPYALLAFQGPLSREILQKLVNVKDLGYYSWLRGKINDIPVFVARVGFTGEIGYELYVNPEYAYELWDTLVEIGKKYDVGPYGFEVFPTLGIEKGLKNFPDEFYEGSTPLELGFSWTIGWDKEDFIGKKALMKRKVEGLKTKLMGLEVSDPKVHISRGDNVVKGGRVVGQVTNVVYSPYVGKNIGFTSVEIDLANEGEELEVEHGKERGTIRLVRGKWYDPENKKVRE